MATIIQWENHQIEINPFISRKYLMLAGETVLKVDGKEVARTGGFHFSEKTCGTFHHEGNRFPIELQLRGGFLYVNFLLKIADNEVAKGKVNLQGLGWACFLWALIGLLLGALTTIIFQKII